MNIKGILPLGGGANVERQKATCNMNALEFSLTCDSSTHLHFASKL